MADEEITRRLVAISIIKWTVIVGFAFGALFGVGSYYFRSSEEIARVADSNNPLQVEVGKKIYVRICAFCHGRKLEGQANWRVRKTDGRLPAPPHDETGHTWHHPDGQLFLMTKIGIKPPLAPEGYESDMPGFKDSLSDVEIWAVLSYIKSKWPAKIRRRRAFSKAREQ